MGQKIIEQYSNKIGIPKTPMAFFWHVTKPFKWSALFAVVIVSIASASSQGTNYFLKLIVDAVEAGETSLVLWYALMYPVAIFLVQSLFRLSAVFGRIWTVGARQYSYDELSKYLLGHSHSYYLNRFAGSIMSKVQNVAGGVDNIIPDLLWTHLTALVSFLVTLAFIMKASVPAGCTFLALVFALFLMNAKMAPKKTMYAKAVAQARTDLSGLFIDVFSNVQAVRQYSKQPDEQTDMEAATKRHAQAGHYNWGYTEKMLYLNGFVLFVFSVGMFWLLVDSWQAGDIGTGDFVLIISLYAQITGTLIFIGRAFNSTSQAVGEMREGLEDLLVPHEVIDKNGAKLSNVTEGHIDWKNVSFGFGTQMIFDDFNLSIPAGQRLGLVGQSGAGKTTFVSLLLRQHDLNNGEIVIDGDNIAEVTQNSLRQAIAVVPQEPALFHRSIRENILYGKPEATEEELVEVAKKAQAYDFIAELPDGFDTMVGERGVKLSGGQKQRVAIARAMLKDAPILVLDEATSALDSESEVLIQKALENLMEGRTVIAIAHRLSTLRKMDRIIVMEEGQIIEDGTHDELANNGQVYERLWDHQAGGFLKE